MVDSDGNSSTRTRRGLVEHTHAAAKRRLRYIGFAATGALFFYVVCVSLAERVEPVRSEIMGSQLRLVCATCEGLPDAGTPLRFWELGERMRCHRVLGFPVVTGSCLWNRGVVEVVANTNLALSGRRERLRRLDDLSSRFGLRAECAALRAAIEDPASRCHATRMAR